jgi:cob(I)alamin adenosyltransferase
MGCDIAHRPRRGWSHSVKLKESDSLLAMGHRLSKITTRTGDRGETGLGDGSRVRKDDLRIVALGEVDELNSTIGLLLTEPLPSETVALLTEIQHDLFDLGGELSIPGRSSLGDDQVRRLEAATEQCNAALAPLKEFILPGGTRAAAIAHVARTVCRRAERALVAVGTQPGDGEGETRQVYLNRLSDLLFVLARTLNRFGGRGDVQWRPARHQK